MTWQKLLQTILICTPELSACVPQRSFLCKENGLGTEIILKRSQFLLMIGGNDMWRDTPTQDSPFSSPWEISRKLLNPTIYPQPWCPPPPHMISLLRNGLQKKKRFPCKIIEMWLTCWKQKRDLIRIYFLECVVLISGGNPTTHTSGYKNKRKTFKESKYYIHLPSLISSDALAKKKPKSLSHGTNLGSWAGPRVMTLENLFARNRELLDLRPPPIESGTNQSPLLSF